MNIKTSPRYARRSVLYAWLMSLPALIGLTVFVVVPLALGVQWSFTDKRLISPLPTRFVGLQNYDRLLSLRFMALEAQLDPHTGQPQRDERGAVVYPSVRGIIRSDPGLADFREWFQFNLFGRQFAAIAKDPTFMQAVVNTFTFVLVIVPFQGGLALVMALLVNQRLRGITLFRTLFFSPVVTSMAVIAVVWTFLYNPDQGLINQFLKAISLGQIQPLRWLVDTDTALPAIILVSAWQAAGFQMVIFLAGLQDIPEALYEAARIDGANTWQLFRYVTFPQLRNTTIFVVISTTILAFRLFTQVDVMTHGGPADATATIIYHVVNQGFRQQRVGYASATTVVFFLIVLAIALLQKSILKSEVAME